MEACQKQGGKVRADYGSGFGVRQLEQARQFYLEYPIANALRSQFNWTQYKLLIAISDTDKREYFGGEIPDVSSYGRAADK